MSEQWWLKVARWRYDSHTGLLEYWPPDDHRTPSTPPTRTWQNISVDEYEAMHDVLHTETDVDRCLQQLRNI